MEKRPKGMPRWQYEESLIKEKENILSEKSLIQPQRSNIFGIIITTCIMIGILWIIFASMGGEPESWNASAPSPYDGSNRAIYP